MGLQGSADRSCGLWRCTCGCGRKCFPPAQERNEPDTLRFDLDHKEIAFGLVVVKGATQSLNEGRHSTLLGSEAIQQVFDRALCFCPPRLLRSGGGSTGTGLTWQDWSGRASWRPLEASHGVGPGLLLATCHELQSARLVGIGQHLMRSLVLEVGSVPASSVVGSPIAGHASIVPNLPGGEGRAPNSAYSY